MLDPELYPLLPLPTSLWLGQEAEIQRLRQWLTSETYDGGGLRWKTNNAVISPSTFKDAYVGCPERQVAAYQEYVDASVAAYRQARANHVPDVEEMFEMRAAFGPGVTVVDVFTGQKFKT